MPILLTPDPSAPLAQGDVLGGIQTYYSDYSAGAVQPVCDKNESGTNEIDGFVLVVSRPCNALRDERIVVAPIVERKLAGIESQETFEDLKAFFEEVRDGFWAPDGFYLGEPSPGVRSRYVAKLDNLRSLRIPSLEKDKEARATFVSKHRKYSLNVEFVRDLHCRIFRAFASLGFDDDRWWTDTDLSLVVRTGKSEALALQSQIQGFETDIERMGLGQGARTDMNRATNDLTVARKNLEKLMRRLTPLEQELDRRRGDLPVAPTTP